MADLADVESTLVGIISAALYPNGVSNPSVSGYTARVFAGWPQVAQLESDLAAGFTEVNVYPRPEERNVTKYNPQWQVTSMGTQTLELDIVEPLSVVIAGKIPASTNPHNVMVMANRSPYVYAVQLTDTLNSIASALAQIISFGVPGTASAGSVINFPEGTLISAARVGVTGTSARELRRQERLFQIGIWAPTYQARTAVAKVVDTALAVLPRINLPDGFSARMRYKNSLLSDGGSKQMLYRRDLFYTVEYAFTQVITSPQIVAIVEKIELPEDAQNITINY